MKGKGNSLDFGARLYDSRLGRWLSLDKLAAKYPGISPYVFTTNNPIVFIDPDGKRVVASGKAAQELLKLSLSPQESKFLEFNKNGEVNTQKLQGGASTFTELSGNYKALLYMSNHQKVVEMVVKNNAPIKNGNGKDDNFRMAKIEEFPIDVNNPKSGTEKIIQGTVGLSLMPLSWKGETSFDKGTRSSPEQSKYSINDDFKVYISEDVYNFDKETAVGNVGHEAYGHVYFFMLGNEVKGGSHGPIRNGNNPNANETNYNGALEQQIKDRTKESKQNYQQHKKDE